METIGVLISTNVIEKGMHQSLTLIGQSVEEMLDFEVKICLLRLKIDPVSHPTYGGRIG